MCGVDVAKWAREFVDAEVAWHRAVKEMYASGKREDRSWQFNKPMPTSVRKARGKAIRAAAQEWLTQNGIEGFVRIEGWDVSRPWRRCDKKEYRLSPPSICIWNSKGSVTTTAKWLNKICATEAKVRSHKVTTDADYLHPLEEQFQAFVAKLVRACKAELAARQGEFPEVE